MEVWRRDEAGAWPVAPEVYPDGAVFELPSLAAPIPVAEVYADILDEDGRWLLR